MEKVNVLVVTDAQNDFATGSLGTAEAKASIPRIVDRIKECGDDGYIILATKDTHETDYLSTNEGKHLPVVHTMSGTYGWDIVSDIRTALDAYGAIDVLKDKFGSADLASVIRVLASQKIGRVITTGEELKIVIVGWCTDICVITNALLLKTAFPEAKIIVDSDCCAGVTPKAHEAALTVMKSCQINVIHCLLEK